MRIDQNKIASMLGFSLLGFCVILLAIVNLTSSVANAREHYPSENALPKSITARKASSDALLPGLQAYYEMDEDTWTNDCTANTVKDWSGNNNYGKACPNGSGPTGGAVGKFAKSGSFDGVDDFISIPYNTSLAISGTGSIAAWSYFNSVTSNEQVIFGQGSNDGGTTGLELELGNILCGGSNAKICFNLDAGPTPLQSVTSLSAGTWYHIAAVWDGTTSKIYLNGILDASKISNYAPLNNSHTRVIGARQTETSAQGYLNGLLDEVRIYNRALNDAEVNQIFKSGPLIFGTPMAYLPVVIAPERTATPTTTPSPTPSPTPIIFPGIYGYVTLNGNPLGGVPIEVRFYNGSGFSTRASGTTSSNGIFDFAGLPGLGPNQAYYVRYRNTTDGSRLGYWATRLLTSYSAGGLVHIGDFDVQDIVTTAPINDEHVTFPYTFKWVKRSNTPSDNYQITFYDANNTSHNTQSPMVGYVSEMNIPSLPTGFNPGQNYLWEVWANQPDNAFGVSFALRPFFYAGNSGQAPSSGIFTDNGIQSSDLRIQDMDSK